MSDDEPCGKCGRSVTYEDNGVGCEGVCGQWYHITCIGMDFDFYMALVCNEHALWKCDDCMTRNFGNRNSNEREEEDSIYASDSDSSCRSHSSDSGDELDHKQNVQVPVAKEKQPSSPMSLPAEKKEVKKPLSDLFVAVKRERELLTELGEEDEEKGRTVIKDLVPFISQELKKDPDAGPDMLKECDIKKEVEEISIEEHCQFQQATDLDADLEDVLSYKQNGNSAVEGELQLETSGACNLDSHLKLSKTENRLVPQENRFAVHSKFSLNCKCHNDVNDRKLSKSRKSYKCNICKKPFEQMKHLKRHRLEVHLGVKRLMCKWCSSAFNSKHALAKHMLSEHEDVSTLLDVARLLSDVKDKEYKCSYCDKYFNCRSAFVSHERSHTREAPFECHLCTRCYTTRGNLNVHLESHGVDVLSSRKESDRRLHHFECDVCKKQLFSKESFQRHVERSCLLKCKGCKKLFDKYHEFRRHVKMCVSEWPVRCDVCGRGFARKRSLTRHLHSHDPSFYYECESCKKRFKRKNLLVGHFRSVCT